MTPERIAELRKVSACQNGQLVHQCWGCLLCDAGSALDGEWDEMLDEIERLQALQPPPPCPTCKGTGLVGTVTVGPNWMQAVSNPCPTCGHLWVLRNEA